MGVVRLTQLSLLLLEGKSTSIAAFWNSHLGEGFVEYPELHTRTHPPSKSVGGL